MEEEPKTPLTPRERQLAGLRPVQKGQVLNPKGRGSSLNKVNQETKELLAMATKNLQPEFEAALGSLMRSENEFSKVRAVEIFVRFLEFTQPRLSATAVKTEGTGNAVIVIGRPADLELPAYEQENTEPHDNGSIEDANVIDTDNLKEDGSENAG